MQRMALHKVKVGKTELLGILRKNRTQHTADYKEAVEGYIEAFQKKAKELARAAKSGDPDTFITMINLQRPHSNEGDYDRAIKMVEMSIEDHLELDSDQFDCLVMDNWDWKDSFSNNTMLYAASKKFVGSSRG